MKSKNKSAPKSLNNNQELEKIFMEGEKIFPINPTSDEKCKELYPINNWAEMFYNLKKGKSKQKFQELISKSEYSKFFEALNYEYGINNVKKDLEKAFVIYKNASDNTTDIMSMYRLYHIYKTDFKKFGLKKRNRVYELLYIYKCFAYLHFQEFERQNSLLNKFDPVCEIATQLYEEETNTNFPKFHKFMKFLEKNANILNIKINDIKLISALIEYKFIITDDIVPVVKILKDLNNNKNLEAIYKLACIYSIHERKSAEQYFISLKNQNYYRSYVDYALYLNNEKRFKEALDILKIAYENGIFQAGIIYYDIYLANTNFNELIDNAKYCETQNNKKSELIFLFDILVNDISFESVYSYFEFFFLRHICFKRFNLGNYFNYYFGDLCKEYIEFLIEITSGDNEKNKKERINKYFLRSEYYQELHLATGSLYYYGIENIIEKNYNKALKFFEISIKASKSNSYKRFCYFFIYKIHEKLLSVNNISTDQKIINNNKLKIYAKTLFEMYYSSLESDSDEFLSLSYSYFYYLSKLYRNKIGNGGDQIMEYICLKRSVECDAGSPGSGSIIGYYRKSKALLKLKEYENQKYEEKLYKIKGLYDCEGYGDDNSICGICYENRRNTVCFPCKHLFCSYCIKKILEKRQCPICRRHIILTWELNGEESK